MKTIDDVLARLDGESMAMVVQLSAKECGEMAALIRADIERQVDEANERREYADIDR